MQCGVKLVNLDVHICLVGLYICSVIIMEFLKIFMLQRGGSMQKVPHLLVQELGKQDHPSKQDCLSLFIVWHVGLHHICSSLLSVCLSVPTAFPMLIYQETKHNTDVRKFPQARRVTLPLSKKPAQSSLTKSSHFLLGLKQGSMSLASSHTSVFSPIAEKLLTDL